MYQTNPVGGLSPHADAGRSILEIEDDMKNMSDAEVVARASLPTHTQFLYANETMRREKQRANDKAQQMGANPPTIVDQIVSGGIAAMNPNPDPLMGAAMGAPPPMMGQDPMMGQMQDPMMGQMPQDIAMGQQMPQDPMMQMQDPMMQDPMMQQGIMAAGGGMMPYRMYGGQGTSAGIDFSNSPIAPDKVRLLRAQGYSDEQIQKIIEEEQFIRNNTLTGQELYGVGEESDIFKGRTSYPLVPESVTEGVKDVLEGSDIAKYGFGYQRNEGGQQGLMGVPMGAVEDLMKGAGVMSDLSERARQSQIARDPIGSSRILSLIDRGMEVPRRGFEQLIGGEVVQMGDKVGDFFRSLSDADATARSYERAPPSSDASNSGNFYLSSLLPNDKQQSPLDSDASVEAARLYAKGLFGPRNNLVVEGEEKKIDKGSVSEDLSEGVDPDLASRSLREDVSRAGEVDPALFEMIMAGEAGGAGKVNPRAKSRMAEGLAIAQLGAGIAKGSVSEGLSGAADAFMDVRESERKERQTDALEKYYQATGQASLQRALLGAAGGLSMDKALEAVMENDKDFDGTQKSSMAENIRQAQELMRLSRIPGADVNPERIDPATLAQSDAQLKERWQLSETSR